MIRNILLTTAALAVVSAVPASAATKKTSATSATLPASNPFAKPSTLPFETPDFSRIKDSDYLPAILAGMAQEKREITAIANQKATPTFDNTVAQIFETLEQGGIEIFEIAVRGEQRGGLGVRRLQRVVRVRAIHRVERILSSFQEQA